MRVVSNPLVPRTMPVLQMHPDCDKAGLWCTPEFRASVDKWLLDMFGEAECALKVGDQLHVHPSRYYEIKELFKPWDGRPPFGVF